jgi:hypothetical protein
VRREKADEYRASWFAEAVAVLRETPMPWKTLAFEVLKRCAKNGITKPNGEPHNQATIYNYLTAQSERISEALESFTAQASAVEERPQIAG